MEIKLGEKKGNIKGLALIDDEDKDKVFAVGEYWTLHPTGYAVCVRQRSGYQETLYLHRVIMDLKSGDKQEVDHKNGNRIDCRKSNLRIGSKSLNAQNKNHLARGSSPFRGVSWNKKMKKWETSVKVGGQRVYHDYWENEVDAAVAVDFMRKCFMPWAETDREIVRRGINFIEIAQ